MNNNDWFLGLLSALVVLGIGMMIGISLGEISSAKQYCESQSMEHAIVDSEYYCYGDNELHPIEWMNEEQ